MSPTPPCPWPGCRCEHRHDPNGMTTIETYLPDGLDMAGVQRYRAEDQARRCPDCDQARQAAGGKAQRRSRSR